MKKLNGLMLAAITMFAANGLMAQTYSESAALFSRTRPTGTARMLGMGGAQISLGGDMSSAYSNPAGLGMFNRSEFSISPAYYNFQNKNGTYTMGGNTISDNNGDTKSGIQIPALGLVFSKPLNDEGFIRGTFAITMTRINDFNSNNRYHHVNSQGSLIDYFIDQANGGTPDQFGSNGAMVNTVTQLAYDNYLIGEASILDPSFPDDQYFTDFDPGINPNVVQDEVIQTKGGQSQWNLSYGANINDKFFLGAGLGIVSLNYQSHKVYSESFTDQPLRSYSLTEDLQIKGTGINLTVGGIVRPVGGLQLGASITTPTRYNINDTYSASMDSHWNNWDYEQDGDPNDATPFLNDESSSTDIINSAYTLNSPWKFSFGASYIFGKVGLISLDIERLNYGGAKYESKTDGLDLTQDNTDIKNTYAARTNVRLGGEVRVQDFRFRAGVGVMPDAVDSRGDNISNTWSTGSLGVGYRKNNFSVDLAYVQLFVNGNIKNSNSVVSYSKSDGNYGNVYVPYTLSNGQGPILSYDQVAQNFIMTFGFSF